MLLSNENSHQMLISLRVSLSLTHAIEKYSNDEYENDKDEDTKEKISWRKGGRLILSLDEHLRHFVQMNQTDLVVSLQQKYNISDDQIKKLNSSRNASVERVSKFSTTPSTVITTGQTSVETLWMYILIPVGVLLVILMIIAIRYWIFVSASKKQKDQGLSDLEMVQKSGEIS